MTPVSKNILLITPTSPVENFFLTSLKKSDSFRNAHIEIIEEMASAINELSVKDYDLLVCDCSDSKISALETLIQMKAVKRFTPLVIMNKPGMEKTAIACLKHGCDHYLVMDEQWHLELPETLDNVVSSHFFKKNLRKRFYSIEEENKQLKDSAMYDTDSSFYSKNYFKSVISRELKRASRHQIDLSCLVLDIKKNKKSKSSGNWSDVLKDFTSVLKGLVRSTDVWARLGENRFAALLPHTSNKQAKLAIKRLQNELSHSAVNIDGKNLNFQWGLSDFSETKIKNEEDLLQRAESSLS